MRNMNLRGLFLVVISFLTVQKMVAQDIDLTHLIVNNDFEYQSEGVVNPAGTSWKPLAQDPPTKFYGWECDLSILGNDSQGINQDFKVDGVPTNHGVNACWIGGNCVLPEFYEFYQIIDKELLTAGTYKVQCLLAAKTNKRTSQRLFANQNVQYHGAESEYALNQTEGEIATFAGWAGDLDGNLQEMEVYTTIGENESLKIGIRTGCVKGDGTIAPKANPMHGWIRVDYFRLTKIDTGSRINNTDIKTNYYVNDGKLTVEGVNAFNVYNINGVKVADVKTNNTNASVDLIKGIYIVKTGKNGEVFKVAVK